MQKGQKTSDFAKRLEIQMNKIEINREVGPIVFSNRMVNVAFIKEFIAIEFIEQHSQQYKGTQRT